MIHYTKHRKKNNCSIENYTKSKILTPIELIWTKIRTRKEGYRNNNTRLQVAYYINYNYNENSRLNNEHRL